MMATTNNRTAAITTLGCRVNQYESRAMAEYLEEHGISVCDDREICDIYIINTCAVTAESERKARQLIRRQIAANPDAVVIVCGCFPQTGADVLCAIPGLDVICGNNKKLAAAKWAVKLAEKQQAPIIDAESFAPEDDFDCEPKIRAFDRVRAYVKIEDGCDSNCAYCIIPSVRGGVRSRPQEEIIAEVTELIKSGCKEIVLTGIETSAYQYGLSELIEKIDGINGIERIRLGSLAPSFVRRAFVDSVAKCTHFMPHFHLSVQSGSSRILALMRRKYNAEQALKNIAYIKEKIPNAGLSADIICGFPDETEQDFGKTLEFARIAQFTHIHAFVYSRRPGTEAAKMDGQIPEPIKKARAQALRECQSKIKASLLDKVIADGTVPDGTAPDGRESKILIETVENGKARGHSENFIEFEIQVNGLSIRGGDIVRVTPRCHDGDIIKGDVIL